MGGTHIPCILGTGSHVTLFSETFLKTHFKDLEAERGTKINWLKLKGANGLQIPYVGYTMLDFKVGGLMFHSGGSSLFLMTVWVHIKGCWACHQTSVGGCGGRDLSRTQSLKEWEWAFSCCQKVLASGPTEVRPVTAHLTKEQPVTVPPGSEMVL